MRTIRQIYTCPCMFCAPSFSFEPTSKYPRPGTNSALLGTTWQFYLLVQFQSRFQRHDRQQRTSIIENTMLINDRTVSDFQIQ
jgi:hypothetical protein